MLLSNQPGQKVNTKWVQVASNALNRFEVFITEVSSQADRRRAEFAVTTAPAISQSSPQGGRIVYYYLFYPGSRSLFFSIPTSQKFPFSINDDFALANIPVVSLLR